jgi:hypothetical protein
MADRVVFGRPPAVGVTDGPKGLWIVGKVDDAVDSKILKLTIYANQTPSAIDWGDSAAWPGTAGLVQDVAPTPGAPGQWHVNHTYGLPHPMNYAVVVEAGGLRARAQFMAGKMPIIDDVTRDGVSRPPYPETQPGVFDERARMLASTRRQMKLPPTHGGFVNR